MYQLHKKELQNHEPPNFENSLLCQDIRLLDCNWTWTFFFSFFLSWRKTSQNKSTQFFAKCLHWQLTFSRKTQLTEPFLNFQLRQRKLPAITEFSVFINSLKLKACAWLILHNRYLKMTAKTMRFFTTNFFCGQFFVDKNKFRRIAWFHYSHRGANSVQTKEIYFLFQNNHIFSAIR